MPDFDSPRILSSRSTMFLMRYIPLTSGLLAILALASAVILRCHDADSYVQYITLDVAFVVAFFALLVVQKYDIKKIVLDKRSIIVTGRFRSCCIDVREITDVEIVPWKNGMQRYLTYLRYPPIGQITFREKTRFGKTVLFIIISIETENPMTCSPETPPIKLGILTAV